LQWLCLNCRVGTPLISPSCSLEEDLGLKLKNDCCYVYS